MKKLRFYLVFVLILLALPILRVRANITYGIDSIDIYGNVIKINGWGYIVNENFCNSSNGTYEQYKMKDGEFASKCAGKDYNSRKYHLTLVSKSDGGRGTIYSKNGIDGNDRSKGISATCVNFYSLNDPNIYGNEFLCDGVSVKKGYSSSEPINYIARNTEIETNSNSTPENELLPAEDEYKRWFYDDIGFSAEIDTSQIVPGETYRLQLCIDKICQDIAVPGIVVYKEGKKLVDSQKDDGTIKISKSSNTFIYSYGQSKGVINQDATRPLYKKGDFWLSSKSGYYRYSTLENKYYFPISNIEDSFKKATEEKVGSHPARSGGFKLYLLKTKPNFSEDRYLYPYINGDETYAEYGALSTWVQFTGTFTVSLGLTCGNTVEGTDARKNYCNKNPQPTDYTECCLSTGGDNCPITTDYKIQKIEPKRYTYWSSSNADYKSASTSSYTKETVKNSAKYCSGTDKTETVFAIGDMLREENNAFCYQKGSFTTTSPNKKGDYILTYAGGSYNLNVQYNTELVCAKLSDRTIESVSYYDDNCNFVETTSTDSEVKFKEDGGTTLNYHKKGQFDLTNHNDNIEYASDIERALKKIPTLILKDSTDNINVRFNTAWTTDIHSQSEQYNPGSIIKHYIDMNGITDPLGGKIYNTGSIYKTFVTKLELKRTFNKENYYKVNNNSCEKDFYYHLDHYYGTLTLSKEENGTCYYTGTATKKMYVTIRDNYKQESITLVADYILTKDGIPESIKNRFTDASGKYVSEVNLSDYYQITIGASNYKGSTQTIPNQNNQQSSSGSNQSGSNQPIYIWKWIWICKIVVYR